jgi:double-strand break repair protein MRE11
MLGDISLAEAAEEEGFDVSDQIAVQKFLRARVGSFSFSLKPDV